MSEHSTEKQNGFLHSVALSPGLYLVATPIGNLRDISLRALDVLNAVDVIVCEDTRVSGKLLKAYDIQKPMLPYNDHNAAKQRKTITEKLANNGKIALISDAGMPLISDPGYKLVQDCRDLGINVTSVPGASAPLTALQLSGLPSDKFSFVGFLPPKSAARQTLLRDWKTVPGTLIAFESGPRLADSIKDIKEALGDRDVVVARELTKMYEEIRRGTATELVDHYAQNGAPKGEIVIVIAPPQEQSATEEEIEDRLRAALTDMKTKEAANFVAEALGLPRKKLYEMALKISKDDD